MGKHLLALAALVALCGCDETSTKAKPSDDDDRSEKRRKKSEKKTQGDPASTAATADRPGGRGGLDVTLDGEPLTIKTALASSEGGSSIELLFSTASPKCSDLEGNGRLLAEGEKSFSLTVAPLLRPQGKVAWGINKIYFNSDTKQGGDLGQVTVERGDAAKGVEGTLEFERVLEASEFLKRPEQKLTVKGAFTAKGCGVISDEAAPEARPQPGLKLSVSGKRFDIVAAVVRPTTFPKPGHELMLSSAPADCEKGPDGADIRLAVHVDADEKVTFASLRGGVFSSQLSASTDEPKLTAGPKGPWEGAGAVGVTMKGEMEVLGYTVVANGELEALRCPKK